MLTFWPREQIIKNVLIVSPLYSDTEFIFYSLKSLQYAFKAFTQWIEHQYQGYAEKFVSVQFYAFCGSFSAILETKVKTVSILKIFFKSSFDMSGVYSGDEHLES